MRKIFKLILVVAYLTFLANFSGFCQENNFKIFGKLLDESSQDPLQGVAILESITGAGVITNANGEFIFVFKAFPINLILTHIGYFKDTIRIENEEQYQKNFEGKTLSLTLRVNPFMLDEVVVSTPGLATKLFGDEPYAIIDYVVKSDRFIGLGYKNHNPLKREIFLGRLSGKIIESKPIPSFQEIYQDCLGEVYAISNDSATHFRIKEDKIFFHQAYNPAYFDDYVKPIQALGDSSYIYVNESKNGLYKDYFVYDIGNQNTRLFYRVGSYGKERGYTNIDTQIKSQIVGKIRRGFIDREQMRIINDRISRQMFNRYNEYKPVSSSMFQLEDSVLLFDFDYQAVHCFTLGAELLWRSDVQVDLNKDFTGRVHYDKISNRYFLEFLNVQQSYLIEIDPRTGIEIETFPIQGFKHIDHISIYNKRVYFLYQPDFGPRGKKLFYIDL